MQQIFCSMCSGDADMAVVDGINYTICSNCGTIYVAETEQYITFDTSPAESLALVQRKLATVTLAMVAINKMYHEIYDVLRKNFDIQ